jgi:hypothetical protein
MTSQQANNSLATKQLEGRKQNKERLTLAVCCNANGSDKLPLLVIGKYETLAASKTSTETALDVSTKATRKLG